MPKVENDEKSTISFQNYQISGKRMKGVAAKLQPSPSKTYECHKMGQNFLWWITNTRVSSESLAEMLLGNQQTKAFPNAPAC